MRPTFWLGSFMLLVGPIADPARAQPAAAPEFDVRVRSVEFQTRHDFPAPRGYFGSWGDPEGTEIRPVFEIRPPQGSPILGAEPRLRLVSLRTDKGDDLLPAKVRSAIQDAYPPQRPQFLFSEQSQGLPMAARYNSDFQSRLLSIPVKSLPSGLRDLEGELSLQVVTDDKTAEFIVAGGPQDYTLAPGVQMRMDPHGGSNGNATASCTIDPASAGERTPILNFASFTSGPSSNLILFRPARGPEGQTTVKATFPSQGLDQARTMLFAHLVYDSRTVSIPFRIDDIPITSFAHPPDAPAPGSESAAPVVVTLNDGFEVRLVRVLVRGSRTLGRRSEAAERPNVILLRLGVYDTTGDRSFGRCTSCPLEAITDEFGRPVGDAASATFQDDRTQWVRFLPCDALDFDGASYAEKNQARTGCVTIPIDQVPPRLGTVRGHVTFYEATKAFTAEADLKPSADPIELGPGVRLIVHEPTIVPDSKPERPAPDWVTIQVDLPPNAFNPLRESSTPRLNVLQFYGPDGTPEPPEDSLPYVRTGNRLDYAIGERVFVGKLTRVRVQVVTSTRCRSLPFEFRNLPCGDE